MPGGIRAKKVNLVPSTPTAPDRAHLGLADGTVIAVGRRPQPDVVAAQPVLASGAAAGSHARHHAPEPGVGE
jgi:hypothetical protein